MSGGRSVEPTEARLRPRRSLSSSEAREKLPALVKEAASVRRPARSLAEHAVEIGPYNRGGAWLVPEVDALAAIRRQDELEQENEDLLEDIGIILLAQERLTEATPADELIPLKELARQFGREHLLAE